MVVKRDQENYTYEKPRHSSFAESSQCRSICSYDTRQGYFGISQLHLVLH